MIRNSAMLSLFLSLLLVTASCSTKNSEPQTDQKISEANEKPGMPDKSIQHCKEAGFESVVVTENGIPTSYLCINPSTNKKCDSWAFYRGNCRLDNSDAPSSADKAIKIKQQ
ncbi:MAG: hypothetical protein JAY90_15050 [Candidatus Thiodiazotropha lotti]|nr:hypothetical protein [Candidatus Thiodiazotropha lotti]